MSNANQQVIDLIPTIRKAVATVLGATHRDVDDVTNDVTIILLAGSLDRLDSDTDRKRFAIRSAKNAALNVTRSHRNSKHGGSVNGTDASTGEASPALGFVVEGNGLDTLERDMQLAALDNAMSACLLADEAKFMGLVLAGHTAKAAASVVGWSQATATRRQPALVATLREFMEECEE